MIDSFQLGGTEWQCASVARGLDRSRFENRCLCFREGGELAREIRTSGVPVDVVPFPGFSRPGAVLALLRIAALMRKHRIQLVQSYGFYSNVPAVLAGRLARVPCLVASRRDMGEFLTPLLRRAERVVFRLADRVVVNAEAIERELIEDHQVSSTKIRVIPTGVDVERFAAAVDGAPRSSKVVAMAARFRRQKDQATFLRAASAVRTAQPETRFVLAGDGPLKPQAEALARDLDLESAVEFTGEVAPGAMPAFLRGVDVAVLASHGNEGIPNAVLESMAAARPVVASRTGGCAEAIEDGVTGFLVPVRDPDRLAERIAWLLANEAEARRMGEAGRKRAEDVFSIPRMVERFSALYDELTQRKVTSRSGRFAA